MPNIGDSERKTQNRVVEFFRDKLHYTYLGNLPDIAVFAVMQVAQISCTIHIWATCMTAKTAISGRSGCIPGC